MAYYFFLDDLMIPVPPEKMQLKVKNRNKTVELIDNTEVNLIKSAGLTEIAFDIRLPGDARPYANYSTSIGQGVLSFVGKKLLGKDLTFRSPGYYLPKIAKLKTSNKPFPFIVLRMGQNFSILFDTCMMMTLEEYSIEENAKEGFDVTVPVKLKQYVDYGTKEVEVHTDENGNQTVSVKQSRSSVRSADALKGALKVRGQMSIWELVKSGGKALTPGNLIRVAEANGMRTPFGNPIKGTDVKIPPGVILK